MLQIKKYNTILKLLIAIILIVIGFYWLSHIRVLIFNKYRSSFFYCSLCSISAISLFIGTMLIYSCFVKDKFITLLSMKAPIKNRMFRLGVDILSGSLLALGFLFILTFLSPPLPFVPSLSCATNWNDVTYLILAIVFFGLRYLLVRNRNKDKLS